MSGSGGDGEGPSINRVQNDSCENLIIITNLATPQAQVINNINVGDILNVDIVTDQGPIQVLDLNGNLAGNVISREQIRLLNCLVKGVVYVAEVIGINNGQCQIRIYSA
jgi:hypothetical protein